MMTKEIYTIGYSGFTQETFLLALKYFRIPAVADVRSVPFSKRNPEFNKEVIKACLLANGIEYVFLGDLCGARMSDPKFFTNGKVDFNLVANCYSFKKGLDRIKNGMAQHSIAIMCAEKDPITCHRMILICRNLKSSKLTIFHILSQTVLESNNDSESRLLAKYRLTRQNLYLSEEEILNIAYNKQGEKIAFKENKSNQNMQL